ncbi:MULTISPECIES: hypothetical protein [Burkholderia]|uniref:hypothetical protein n=1 Tax=Burkholderia TaxID=32008 RepID=UPI0021C21102|nr:hypothetical protein [Burkholderia multivorans]MCA8223430.1 hypothetical protein [Burkholderia multivorans]MDN7944850.1 hypothetical protein [Burkholderia multivorans]MDR9049224.1 hypothetical protein [Burkholderia multivorans]MDR9056907.1 hypothetical protein [Burkholderia multivorans]MDR9060900.1 hypothetical protein [Burkholderia multivorans]
MTERHMPITRFRIARPAKRGRPMNQHRPVRLSEARRLLDALVTRELHHSLARVMRNSAIEHNVRAATAPAVPQRRAVFNVGRIDLSKCQLPIFSDAEAEAMARRQTLAHFGLDPDR